MALKTQWEVKENTLFINVAEGEDVAKGEKFKPTGQAFDRQVDLKALGYADLSEVGQCALEFGVFTRLRNATAGKTLGEAQSNIDAILIAWENGEWGAERIGSATPFGEGSLLVRAILRAAPDMAAGDIVVKLNARAEATAKANFADAAFADLEDKDRAKVRRAVVESYTKQPKIARAVVELEQEAAALRAKKKLAALGDAADGAVAL